MKAIPFKHQNVVFAKNQPEYTPLPALKYLNDCTHEKAGQTIELRDYEKEN